MKIDKGSVDTCPYCKGDMPLAHEGFGGSCPTCGWWCSLWEVGGVWKWYKYPQNGRQQMQITEIDPNKKYVLALPEARREYALQIHAALEELIEGDETILVIFGTEVAIIPADLVVGYVTYYKSDADG